jgi:hypothetical protein
MITVARMARVLRKVFEQDARALAREMGVIKRERKVNGATLVLLLVLGWLHEPQAGPSALARFAGSLGVTISKQGIEDHWTYSTAEWLYAVLLRAVQCLISAKAVALPLLRVLPGSTLRMAARSAYPMVWSATGAAVGEATGRPKGRRPG